MGYGYVGNFGWLFYKIIVFVVASFVFSFIFWSTKKWFDMKSAKKRK